MRVFLYHHLKYLQGKERYERRWEQASLSLQCHWAGRDQHTLQLPLLYRCTKGTCVPGCVGCQPLPSICSMYRSADTSRQSSGSSGLPARAQRENRALQYPRAGLPACAGAGGFLRCPWRRGNAHKDHHQPPCLAGHVLLRKVWEQRHKPREAIRCSRDLYTLLFHLHVAIVTHSPATSHCHIPGADGMGQPCPGGGNACCPQLAGSWGLTSARTPAVQPGTAHQIIPHPEAWGIKRHPSRGHTCTRLCQHHPGQDKQGCTPSWHL